MNIKNHYHTSDLALAGALSLFVPINSLDMRKPQKVEFLFERSRELDQLIETYWRRELRIEPQAYFAQLKSIKARIYSRE